jgi:hypothetical protein
LLLNDSKFKYTFDDATVDSGIFKPLSKFIKFKLSGLYTAVKGYKIDIDERTVVIIYIYINVYLN